MMKTAFACALAAAVLTATGASAQEGPEVAWNVGIVSDYVFRGFSQTADDPAVQGGVDATAGSFYGGVWASQVDFGDGTDAEVDLYGGYRTEMAGFDVDFGAVAYLYISAPALASYDYVELKAAASRAVGPVTAGAAIYWTPNFYGVDDEATYVEANLAVAAADKWTVSGAIGQQWLDVNEDYAAWHAGVTYAASDHVAIDVRYHGSDVDGPLSEDRLVAGLKFSY
jgi:uncharacterized protein (TIGR02001 family)